MQNFSKNSSESGPVLAGVISQEKGAVVPLQALTQTVWFHQQQWNYFKPQLVILWDHNLLLPFTAVTYPYSVLVLIALDTNEPQHCLWGYGTDYPSLMTSQIVCSLKKSSEDEQIQALFPANSLVLSSINWLRNKMRNRWRQGGKWRRGLEVVGACEKPEKVPWVERKEYE